MRLLESMVRKLKTRPLVGLAFLPAVILGSALGAGSSTAGPVRACPEAGRATVVMPAGVDGIDGFRVLVGAAPRGAAIDVTILAGESDRTLRVESTGATTLLLDAPLSARWIDVALEPVLEAPAPACVERVELLRGGMVVGAAAIE
jgi:hypothetical protein